LSDSEGHDALGVTDAGSVTTSGVSSEAERRRPDQIPRHAAPRVAVGALVSTLVFLATQFSMLTRLGWTVGSFRLYTAFDQMANLAIVVNGAHGNFSSVEPFTETGSMIDPHLYFTLLGIVAHISGISPAVVYNVVGIGVQTLLVVGLSVGFVMLTERWWSAYFGAVPYLLGTLSSVTGGAWFTSLQSHGVLWGAFGVMFALNSQSVAISVAALLMIAMMVRVRRQSRVLTNVGFGIVIGAGVGFLANVDTYSFFATVFFSVFGLAAYGLATCGDRRAVVLSTVLLAVLLVAGDSLATVVGRVAIFAAALLPATPGVVLAARRWKGGVLAALVALVVAASPQLIRYVLAARADDPFLKYRQVSSAHLSVPWHQAIVCALPLLTPLLFILVSGVYRRNSMWVAYSSGSLVAWLLLAENNFWGANQEPYQLWIIGYALVAFTIVPVLIDVATTLRESQGRGRGAPRRRWWNVSCRPRWIAFAACSVAIWFVVLRSDLWGTNQAAYRWWIDGLIVMVVTGVPILLDAVLFGEGDSPRRHSGSRWWNLVIAVLMMSSIGTAELSTIDWYHFYLATEGQSFSFATAQDRAMAGVAAHVTNRQLVLVDQCLNPEILKVITDVRVAYYSVGLAWPRSYAAIKRAFTSVTTDSTTPAEARAAGIGWLVTLTTCHDVWPNAFSRSLEHVASEQIGPSTRGAVTLWRIRDGADPENR